MGTGLRMSHRRHVRRRATIDAAWKTSWSDTWQRYVALFRNRGRRTPLRRGALKVPKSSNGTKGGRSPSPMTQSSCSMRTATGSTRRGPETNIKRAFRFWLSRRLYFQGEAPIWPVVNTGRLRHSNLYPRKGRRLSVPAYFHGLAGDHTARAAQVAPEGQVPVIRVLDQIQARETVSLVSIRQHC